MKTTKELLQLMLDRQDLFRSGLCGWAGNLYIEDAITSNEYNSLMKFIAIKNPASAGNYWWKRGEIEPRIEWIKQQLEA